MGIRISDLPSVEAQVTHEIPASNGGVTGKITVQSILSKIHTNLRVFPEGSSLNNAVGSDGDVALQVGAGGATKTFKFFIKSDGTWGPTGHEHHSKNRSNYRAQ